MLEPPDPYRLALGVTAFGKFRVWRVVHAVVIG